MEEPAPTRSVPAPETSTWVKDALLALSLANLVFIQTWAELLFDADGGYFNKLRVEWFTLLALLANLVWAGTAGWLILRGVRRTRSVWLRQLVVLITTLALMQSANYVRVQLLGWSLGGLLRYGGLPTVGLLGLVGLGILLRYHALVGRVEVALLSILSPMAFLTVGRVLLVLPGLSTIRQHDGNVDVAGMLNTTARSPRIVWVIFDEMDERLAFSERPMGLLLPEFDRLREESLVLTNAYPPGDCTLISMPALTTGRAVRQSKATGPATLELSLGDGSPGVRWGDLTNVFDRIRSLGFNTGAVGWYHPYDRVMGRSFSRVAWYPFMWFEMARGRSFTECLWNQITAVSFVEHRRRLGADYGQAMSDALSMTTDPGLTVSLIHLPTPHPPGIYDGRREHLSVTQFSRLQGYLNNLRLADRSLGQLREHLAAQGLWSNTWFIASSDHWWRQSGSGDHRVPLLVKPPAQAGPEVFGGLVNTVITGDLILAILRAEVTDLATATEWMGRHIVKSPPDYGSATGDG